MRMLLVAALSWLLWRAAETPTSKPAAQVVLQRGGASAAIDGLTQDKLRGLAIRYLESSNFNTVTHPQILKQNVPAIQERYRRILAGDYLLISYPEPVVVQTVGGEVPTYEIVIGLGRADYAEGLITIDPQGRVVSHGKYSGIVGIELRQAVPAP